MWCSILCGGWWWWLASITSVYCGAYQICSRLVLQPAEESVLTHKSGLSQRHRQSGAAEVNHTQLKMVQVQLSYPRTTGQITSIPSSSKILLKGSRRCTIWDFRSNTLGKPSWTTRRRASGWWPDKKELPPIVLPPGLSMERRKYLFEEIREFCLQDWRYRLPWARWQQNTTNA